MWRTQTCSSHLQSSSKRTGIVTLGSSRLIGYAVYFMKLFGILPESRVLAEYAERCLARPGYQKALARDSELDA